MKDETEKSHIKSKEKKYVFSAVEKEVCVNDFKE
jgi:hypothetical protein